MIIQYKKGNINSERPDFKPQEDIAYDNNTIKEPNNKEELLDNNQINNDDSSLPRRKPGKLESSKNYIQGFAKNTADSFNFTVNYHRKIDINRNFWNKIKEREEQARASGLKTPSMTDYQIGADAIGASAWDWIVKYDNEFFEQISEQTEESFKSAEDYLEEFKIDYNDMADLYHDSGLGANITGGLAGFVWRNLKYSTSIDDLINLVAAPGEAVVAATAAGAIGGPVGATVGFTSAIAYQAAIGAGTSLIRRAEAKEWELKLKNEVETVGEAMAEGAIGGAVGAALFRGSAAGFNKIKNLGSIFEGKNHTATSIALRDQSARSSPNHATHRNALNLLEELKPEEAFDRLDSTPLQPMKEALLSEDAIVAESVLEVTKGSNKVLIDNDSFYTGNLPLNESQINDIKQFPESIREIGKFSDEVKQEITGASGEFIGRARESVRESGKTSGELASATIPAREKLLEQSIRRRYRTAIKSPENLVDSTNYTPRELDSFDNEKLGSLLKEYVRENIDFTAEERNLLAANRRENIQKSKDIFDYNEYKANAITNITDYLGKDNADAVGSVIDRFFVSATDKDYFLPTAVFSGKKLSGIYRDLTALGLKDPDVIDLPRVRRVKQAKTSDMLQFMAEYSRKSQQYKQAIEIQKAVKENPALNKLWTKSSTATKIINHLADSEDFYRKNIYGRHYNNFKKNLGDLDPRTIKDIDILKAHYGENTTPLATKYISTWRESVSKPLATEKVRAGIFVKAEDEYFPFKWSPVKISAAAANPIESRAVFIKSLRDNLNWDKTRYKSGELVAPDAREDFLSSVYNNIMVSADLLSKIDKTNVFKEVPNHERKIFFKDAEAHLAAAKQYSTHKSGEYSPQEFLVDYIDNQSKYLAKVYARGTMGREFELNSTKAIILSSLKDKKLSLFNEALLKNNYDVSEGVTGATGLVARIYKNTANIGKASMLAGSQMSTFLDWAPMIAHNWIFSGEFTPIFKNYLTAVKGLTKTEKAEIGILSENLLNRYDPQWALDSKDGKIATSNLVSNVIKYNGTEYLTDLNKTASSLSYFNMMGKFLDGDFDNLGKESPALKNWLETNHLVDAAVWENWRSIPKANLRGIEMPTLTTANEFLNFEDALKFSQAHWDMQGLMVPEATRAGRNFGKLVTFDNQIAKDTFFLKSFAFSTFVRQAGALIGNLKTGNTTKNASNSGKIILTMMAVSVAHKAIKEYIKGRDPLATPETRHKLLIDSIRENDLTSLPLDLMSNYGASGSYQNTADKMLGSLYGGFYKPIGGALLDSAKLGYATATDNDKLQTKSRRKINKNLRKLDPIKRIPFLGMVWERTVFDQIQALVDPDAQDYFNSLMKKNEYWWEPGEKLPDPLN